MNDATLIARFQALQLTMDRALDDALHGIGLNTAQLRVLEALQHLPGASNADLARECDVTPQSLHGVLLNLEANGLLVREPHRIHARVLRTYLSNAGHAKLAAGRAAVAQVEERMVATFSEEEIETLQRMIAACTGALRGK